jgi:hypothetical protein
MRVIGNEIEQNVSVDQRHASPVKPGAGVPTQPSKAARWLLLVGPHDHDAAISSAAKINLAPGRDPKEVADRLRNCDLPLCSNGGGHVRLGNITSSEGITSWGPFNACAYPIRLSCDRPSKLPSLIVRRAHLK